MGGKTSTSSSKVTIPKEVMERYTAVNKMAEDVAQNPFKQFGKKPEDFVAGINNQQRAGMQQIGNAADMADPYYQKAAQYTRQGAQDASPEELNIKKYLSPFTQQVVDKTANVIDQGNEQAMSGSLGDAIRNGGFGGDRSQIASAVLAGQQGMARGKTLADLYQQGYNTALGTAQGQQQIDLAARQADLARLTGAGQQYAALGQGRQATALQGGEAQINAGTLAQQTQQAGKTAMYQQFLQKQGYPFQVAQFLANIAMGTGSLSGSTTTTTQPSSFFSDRRLKHDIRRIGRTDDGLPIYRFKYKGDESDQTHIGFMADEVEKKKPEAVGQSQGFKTVDYDRATKAEGGVAGPYGAPAEGSSPYPTGYVPQAYLEVRDLLKADPSLLQNDQQTLAQALEAAGNFGKNIVGLKDTFGTMKGWISDDQPAAETTTTTDTSAYATGGTVGGVMVDDDDDADYLDSKPAATPEMMSYVKGTLDQQDEDTGKLASLQAAAPPPPQPSGASQVGGMASGLGSLASGVAALFALSDRRAKHDFKRIGYTDNGLPIHSFKYKGDEAQRTHIGFMADEVERVDPGAVMSMDGLKYVDYARASEAKAYGGAVGDRFERRGYEVGGWTGGAPAVDPDQETLARLEDQFKRDYVASQTRSLGDITDRAYSPAVAPVAAKQEESTLQPIRFDRNMVRSMVDPTPITARDGTQRIVEKAPVATPLTNAALRASATDATARRQGFESDTALRGLDGSYGDRPRVFPNHATYGDRPRVFPARPKTLADVRPPSRRYVPPGFHINSLDDETLVANPSKVAASDLITPKSHGDTDEGQEEYDTTMSSLQAKADKIKAERKVDLGTPALETKTVKNAPVIAEPKDEPKAKPSGNQVFDGFSAVIDANVKNPYARAAIYNTGNRESRFSSRNAYRNWNDPGKDGKYARAGGIMSWRDNPEGVQRYSNMLQYVEDHGGDPRRPDPALQAQFLLQEDPDLIKRLEAAKSPEEAQQIMNRAWAFKGFNNPRHPETRARMAGVRDWVEGGVDLAKDVTGSVVNTGKEVVDAAGNIVRAAPSAVRNTLDTAGDITTNVGNFIKRNSGNTDLLLSVLSGLGTMASSPSRYLGSAILQGIGGGASTYAGLQKQGADIRQTDAEAQNIANRTANESIFTVDGVSWIRLADGRQQKFWDWYKNPAGPSGGGKAFDDMNRRIAQSAINNGLDPSTATYDDIIKVSPDKVQGTETTAPAKVEGTPADDAGLPVPDQTKVEAPTGVRWTDASKQAVEQNDQLLTSQPGLLVPLREQTTAAVGDAQQKAQAANDNVQNLSEQASVVSAAITDKNIGALGSVYANGPVKWYNTLARSMGWDEVTGDIDADTQRVMLDKLATVNAGNIKPQDQSSYQALADFMEVSPNLDMTPEAASMLTAQQMTKNQRAIDRANYMTAALTQSPTGTGVWTQANDAAFNAEMRDIYNQERDQITRLFQLSSKDGRVKKFMHDAAAGRFTTPEEAASVLQKIMGDDISPLIGRYFTGGR